MTGDFLPDRNPSTSGGEGAIGRKRLNTWEGGPLGDDNRGMLSSPSFEITDDYLNFLLGGGGRSDGSLQAELLVDGQVVEDGDRLERRHPQLEELGRPCLPRSRRGAPDQGPGHRRVGTPDLRPPRCSARPPRFLAVWKPPSTWSSTARSSAPPPAPTAKHWTGSAGTSAICRVSRLAIQIIDNNTGGWGHVLADQFTFANAPAQSATQRAHWLDYGRDFYAGVTFNDVPKGKRIMVAWMNNWQYAQDIPTDPWRSAMSVPRELTLERIAGKTELVGTPVRQLQSLRHGRPFQARNARGCSKGPPLCGDSGARGDTVEIMAEFRARDAEKFGVHVRAGNGQRTVDRLRRRLEELSTSTAPGPATSASTRPSRAWSTHLCG